MTPSIDKDIMEKADDVYEDAVARFGILVSKSSRAALVVVISRALQAVRNEERERCAKIVDDEYAKQKEFSMLGYANYLATITAIRKGGE